MAFDLCEQHMILSQSQALNSSHKLLHWNVISNHRISYTNTPCLCPGSTQSWRLSVWQRRGPSSERSWISWICTHADKSSLGWGQICNSKYTWLQISILKQGQSSIWWLKYPLQPLCGHTQNTFRMTQHRDNILLRKSRPKPLIWNTSSWIQQTAQRDHAAWWHMGLESVCFFYTILREDLPLWVLQIHSSSCFALLPRVSSLLFWVTQAAASHTAHNPKPGCWGTSSCPGKEGGGGNSSPKRPQPG